MTARPRRTSPVWSDVKGKLAGFDRAGLVGLVQDLYAASEANRTFLHAQFGLGADLLAPYKCDDRTLALAQCSQEPGCVGIRRQEGPLGFQRPPAHQRKGLAEPMVFYCERAACFAREYGMDDPGYLDALVRMFEQALKVPVTLADAERDAVRVASRDFGFGVGYNIPKLLAKYRRK